MSTRVPPPNWLRTFEAAARHLSFTSAAQELHVTQSAVSQHVRLLEHYLHETLFLRHKRRLELTPAGKAYLEILNKSFNDIRRGTEELFGPKNPNRISIKTNVSFSTLWLAPRFPRFTSAYPDFEVRLTNAIWWDFSERSDADLEIRFGDGQWPGYKSYKLSDEFLVPMASKTFISQHKLKDPKQLLGLPLFHIIGDRYGWRDWFAYAGVETKSPISTGLQFDTTILALSMAKNCLGVALGLKSLGQEYLDTDQLKMAFDIELAIDDCFYLAVPENQPKRTHTDAFIQWILSEVETN